MLAPLLFSLAPQCLPQFCILEWPVGGGRQILEVRKIFARISLNLSEKFV